MAWAVGMHGASALPGHTVNKDGVQVCTPPQVTGSKHVAAMDPQEKTRWWPQKKELDARPTWRLTQHTCKGAAALGVPLAWTLPPAGTFWNFLSAPRLSDAVATSPSWPLSI